MLHTILFIVSYDVWFFISHIFLHHPFLYEWIHKIHHNRPYKYLTYLDTNHGHILETSIQSLGLVLPFLLFRVHIYSFFVACMILGTRGCMRHDHRCSWLIGNHHLLHHKYPSYNFGEYWLDQFFGTCYPNKEEYIYGWIYV